MRTLNQIDRNKPFVVTEILTADELLAVRLQQLGIYAGIEITLNRTAPIFGDPMLFQVGESQIALTKSEAKLVGVEEKA